MLVLYDLFWARKELKEERSTNYVFGDFFFIFDEVVFNGFSQAGFHSYHIST